MIIANPLLRLSDFRMRGISRYRHGGQIVHLGIGENRGWGWSSPVEANFSETSAGRDARGSTPMDRFYVVRQRLVVEKQWYWVQSPGQPDRWNLQSTQANLPDDPDSTLVTISAMPAVVSFIDSPGFPVHNFFRIQESVLRVCALQNFRLWIEVSSTYSRGNFQAASDELWHHLLCLQRTTDSWQVVRNQSLLGRGELVLASPLWQ